MIDKALRESRKKQADCPAFGLSVLVASCQIGRQHVISDQNSEEESN
jgi:hypothetical protein